MIKHLGKIETEVVHISIENLSVVWVQAQRPFNEKWANEIAENFDPDKFDPPVITKPNGVGHYHVVEGQHRIKAAEIALGRNQKLPCRIVDADNPARAAEIWLGINGARKSTTPVQAFLISVVAGRQPQTEINELVTKMGYKIGPKKGDYCISAVTAMVNIHQRLGKNVLHATLLELHRTWEGDSTAFSGAIMQGYAAFINEWRGMDHRRLVEVVKTGVRSLSAATPHQLLTAGKTYAEQMRMTLTEAISEELRRRYNKNLTQDKQLRRK